MRRFPWLEVLIGGCACLLVWLIGYPQYKEKLDMSNCYQVRVNMYTLRASIENYTAYNEGRFPMRVEDFEPFLTYPINPYTNKPLNKANIKLFQYNSTEDPKDHSSGGKNGRLRGKPGELAYGYFTAPGDEYPSAYGIVGFDIIGMPLSKKLPSGEIEIFVLHE